MPRMQQKLLRLAGFAVLALAASAVFFAGTRQADSQGADDRLSGASCRIPGYAHTLLCGTLTVSLRDGKESAATRTLRWYKIPARARYPLADPVVWIADGPGVYPTDRAPAMLGALRRVMNDRDLIWLEPRGLPATPETGCIPPGYASMTDKIEPLQAGATRCRAAWAAWGGAEGLTASVHAEDLEQLRTGLGLGQVNLLAEGYGARVAEAWAVRYPASIRRMVLDSPAPARQALAQRAERTADALRKVFASCTAHAACAVRFPDPAADLARIRKALPVRLTLVHPQTGRGEALDMDDRRLALMLERLVKNPARAAALPAALHAAAQGQWSALLGLAAMGWSAQDGAFAWELWLADACQSRSRRESLPQDRLAAWLFSAAQQTLDQHCGSHPPASPMTLETHRIEVPTLALVGRFDPLSGHALRDGTVQIEVDTGHGVLGHGCAQDVVFRFIRGGPRADIQSLEAECLASVPYPTPFVPADLVVNTGEDAS